MTKTALITGASQGIGKAIALKLAGAGYHPILLARYPKKLEGVDDEIQAITGKPATIVPLDLMDGDKIDQLGATLFQRFGQLDVLIGNAGMLGDLTPLTHYDPKLFEKVMATNFTANFRLIRSMDPLLRAAPAAKAIFVSSGVTKRPRPFWGAYSISKVALENLVTTYKLESENTNIEIALFDPGVVATQMRALAFPGETTPAQSPEQVANTFFKKFFKTNNSIQAA